MVRPEPSAAAQHPDVAHASLRVVAEQALSRAAGAPLIAGNAVALLRDAPANYPAWLDAIGQARSSIFMESYIFAEDPVGNEFAQAMIAAARRGVRVHVLQDWLGGRSEASSSAGSTLSASSRPWAGCAGTTARAWSSMDGSGSSPACASPRAGPE